MWIEKFFHHLIKICFYWGISGLLLTKVANFKTVFVITDIQSHQQKIVEKSSTTFQIQFLSNKVESARAAWSSLFWHPRIVYGGLKPVVVLRY